MSKASKANMNIHSVRAGRLPMWLCAALCAPGLAGAMDIATDNPDLTVRWDNNLRYNLGVRAQQQDPKILNTFNYDDSDAKFKRGSVVMNRLDLLSELDVIYQKRSGLRLSTAVWYDHAYQNSRVRTGPASTIPGLGDVSSAYPDNQYSGYTRRWNKGASAELLDAFLFTGVDLDGHALNVRLGQHTIYWGESLFSFVHGVSFAQGPIDIRKALSNPGVDAKELFKPLPQLSATYQVNDEMMVAGQYFFDWRPSVFPDGGTYFGVLDALSGGGGTYLINPALAGAYSGAFGTSVAPVPFVASYGKPRHSGDWGLMTRWTAPMLNGGNIGLYYRRYTDTLPQLVLEGFQPGLPIPTSFGLAYRPEQATLIGASIAGQLAGLSVSGEVSHRGNGALLMGNATVLGAQPAGNTWHALGNAIAYLGATPVFDSAALTTEVSYSRLDKVTRNGQNYAAHGYDALTCPVPGTLGCATSDAWGIALKFEPKWFQVIAGGDLTMPLVYQRGVKGTSPVLFGGYEGNGSYSAGLTLTQQEKYLFTLAYNGAFAKRGSAVNPVTGQPQVGLVGGIGAQWDRGWLSLTLKTTF